MKFLDELTSFISSITAPHVVFVAKIVLVVAFVLFAVLHVAWMVYVWRLDYRWKYAQALQKECGKNALERDTIRWNMMNVFNKDGAALKTLKGYTQMYMVVFLIVYFVTSLVVVVASLRTFQPVTTGFAAFLEKTQQIPTRVYLNAVAVIFIYITYHVIVSKYFGKGPRRNKLQDLMREYKTSLENVEKTLNLMKTRAQPSNTQYDREKELQERLIKRIIMVENTESVEAGAAILRTTSPSDLIGYLQFADDLSSTALCRFVKDDVMKFSEQEFNTFATNLSAFRTSVEEILQAPSGAGRSLSASSNGNTLAMGANGFVYVFNQYGNVQTVYGGSDKNTKDNFGISVALSSDGNLLAVGAYTHDNSGGEDAGSVYIFKRIGDTWKQLQRIQAPDAAAGDRFGCSIAFSGDITTLAIGAFADSHTGGINAGSVYIFTPSGNGWTQQSRLQSSNARSGASFGWSVALSFDGNKLAVGTSNDTPIMQRTGTGSVYMFTRENATWTQKQEIKSNHVSQSNNFGVSVALSSDGKILAVGSDSNQGSTFSGAGAVFVLVQNQNGSWEHSHTLSAPTKVLGDKFGTSVALSFDGTMLLVGANGAPQPNKTNAGMAVIYQKSAKTSQWTQQMIIQASNAAANDRFGSSVAMSSNGSTLYIGSQYNGGSVYMYKPDIKALKTAITSNISSKSKYPYFHAYITSLKDENLQTFLNTWWALPDIWSTTNTLRITASNYKDEEFWINTIAPLICQYWTETWKWDDRLKRLDFGDPSKRLKPMFRTLKIYFGLAIVFIAAVLYSYIPKGPIIPLMFVALIIVFLSAYLMQFV